MKVYSWHKTWVESNVLDDSSLLERVRNNEIDLILVGSDCVTETSVVNKVGTRQLATEAASTRSKVYCCTDRWKQWDDIFPPPLEDIFEPIPKELFDAIIMPPPLVTNVKRRINSEHCRRI